MTTERAGIGEYLIALLFVQGRRAMIAVLLFVVQHAAALVLLLLTAAASGTAVAGARIPLALRSALGLAIAGQTLVVLGTFGAIRPWTLCALAAIAFAVGAVRMEWSTPSWPTIAALTAVTVPLFILAIHPPLAFDETLYHLPFIRAIAGSGAIDFLPDLRFPIFPELHESLCVPGFLALGDVATHLVSVAEVVLLAGLMIEWLPRRAGLLAAALVLGNPIVIHHATITYVDSALMLFVAAGFFCLDRAIQENGTRYCVAAGIFFGTACSVKYLGAYFAIAALLFLSLFASNRRRTVPAFLFAFVLAIVPMYGRIIAFTGNPAFPFLKSVFGDSPWFSEPSRNDQPLIRAVRLFWDMTFARQHVNQQPPYSPLFAVSALITLLVAGRDRRAAFLCALSAIYIAVFVLFLPHDSRYLLPLLPLASIAAAQVMARWERLTIAVSVLSIVAGVAYAGYRFAVLGPPPLDKAGRQKFLERRIPEYRALERRGRGRVYVCGAEQLRYFGGEDVLGDVVGPAGNPRMFAGRDARELSGALRPLGVRYVLLSKRVCPPEWSRIPAPPYFELVYADAGAVLWRLGASPETKR